jgi:hypothetical protein
LSSLEWFPVLGFALNGAYLFVRANQISRRFLEQARYSPFRKFSSGTMAHPWVIRGLGLISIAAGIALGALFRSA